LDNLLWDRNIIRNIFNFDYKWEAYTPQKDRKYGHYVLPILFGSKFIGRIEPKINRKEHLLEICGIWLEDGVIWDNQLESAFQHNIEHFIAFSNTKGFKWKCKKP